MKNKKQTVKTISAAWAAISGVLATKDWGRTGEKYLAENIAEERGHRGFCAGRGDYALSVPQAARLFAVSQIAKQLTGEPLPGLRNYLTCRKSTFTAAALVLNYGVELRAALAPFDPMELATLDYAVLIQP
jgi:hypothetical protein